MRWMLFVLLRKMNYFWVGEKDPIQFPTRGPFVGYVSEKSCDEMVGCSVGPKILRTRKGDFSLDGPSRLIGKEVQVVSNIVFAGKAQELGKRKNIMSVKHSTRVPRSEAVVIRGKTSHKGGFPELPFNNKLRKFSAPIMHKNRSVRRKKVDRPTVGMESPPSSDSIQDSQSPVLCSSPVDRSSTPAVEEGFTLEVVLPFLPASDVTIPRPGANQVDSGMASLIQDEDTVVVTRATDCILEPPSRQVMEATRLMQIQEDIGIAIQGNKEDHLQRIMDLEVRDAAEKEGWELNREIRGSQ
jgi:hypothetical protein